ncbi:hypothetical protein SAMN05216439_1900 [Methanobrevibacter gottschalkii]|uniref:Transcriptional regulator n=2 Tax=Methanobrevibacter gottschalkii TaxID=190974 RepID=A0A3N5C3T5_9EURY|nr:MULTISPECIES: hypothetical protein [Methanobrevibacter]MCQ2970575.1 hypothetical protein [archaeon]OEC96948.1 hypothetical protein A9505_06075 [Methanobrevibacter sp. A27]RPF50961.1 hypothetical protein EDC42_1622 [Methanobrevibacter gottschalkii DSM 11977]SEL07762.1 hypothetical protein SAMN05216439_1900 [Methanobrevibacter gottschalkii]
MCRDKKLLEKIAYVQGSEHRKNIILYMEYNLYTPKELGDAIGVRTNHISNLLSQLKKQNIVYCATPNIHKGKLYSLTDEGKHIFEYLKSKEEDKINRINNSI